MSITTTMSKTPGARQHNRGWMKMLREERRVEAAERQAAYLVEHPWSTPVEDMLKRITTDPGIVGAVNAYEDEIEAKAPRRRKRTVTRKHNA